MSDHQSNSMSAWFTGPKAENGEWFAETIQRTIQDYHSWRRNYFPEDGVVVDSAARRQNEAFRDAFDDRFSELLARLKADFPFYSPRYAAHMLAEQSLPAIAGYFAAMLHNPNNISTEAAPVTVRLEVESARLIARMLGYDDRSWGHLTGGGTVANFEALWIARTTKYLPLVLADARRALGLADLPELTHADTPVQLITIPPQQTLELLARTITDGHAAATDPGVAAARLDAAMRASPWNVCTQGVGPVLAALQSLPAILVPETHHYCFEKAVDLLGLGRRSLVSVPVDADFRMDMSALRRTLDELARERRHILAVVGVVGTTEEGAVDPVDQIIHLRSERTDSFWVHADAAYGGYLRTVTIPDRCGLGEPTAHTRIGGRPVSLHLHLPEHSACNALERLGDCDSVTIDPHKLGYIPYSAGAICFKSDRVKHIARQDAPYLAERPGEPGDAASDGVGMYILEGSKPGAAAAAVWLSHTLIPLDTTGHGRLVRDTIRNACELHALLQQYPELEPSTRSRAVPLCAPGSNIVCYAFTDAARTLPLAALNHLNRSIYQKFTLRAGERVYDQSFFVSRTTLSPDRYGMEASSDFLGRLGVSAEQYRVEGVFLLRSVLMNPWYTHAKARGRYFLAELVTELYKAADECLAANPQPHPGINHEPKPAPPSASGARHGNKKPLVSNAGER